MCLCVYACASPPFTRGLQDVSSFETIFCQVSGFIDVKGKLKRSGEKDLIPAHLVSSLLSGRY